MTELQQKLLNSLKDSGFQKTPVDLYNESGDAENVKEALEDLQAQGMIVLVSEIYKVLVTNKGWVEMGWVNREEAAEDIAKMVELEKQLKAVLEEMGKIFPVQFWDVSSDYVSEFAGVEMNYTDKRVYVKLQEPSRGSQATSAFAEM